MIKKILLTFFISHLLFLSGCIYRIDVPQGNYIEQDRVDLLRLNMSREQVQYVLGTPIAIDPYDKNRWIYIFRIQEGWKDPIQKNLFVIFDGDKLLDIKGDYSKGEKFNEILN